MVDISDNQILKQLKSKLATLLEEDRKAAVEKEKRDLLIKKTTVAIEVFSESEDNTYIIDLSKEVNDKGNIDKELNSFDYSKGKTWKDKIKNYMIYTGKAVTISELVGEFKKHEPNYTEPQINGAMNNAVQAMFRKGVLKVYTPPVKMKGYYYANPLWFDGEALKEEHIPDFKKKLVW